jgi:peptide/nickel transport system substrate-binding protein
MVGRMILSTVTLALLAVGCAQPQGANVSQQGSDPGAPVYGGRLNVPMDKDPWDWDSSYAGKSTTNIYGLDLGYSSLLSFKQAPGQPYTEQVLQPEVATHWEISPDVKTFTFHLRKGVKYVDAAPVNGREITSADVKWAFEYHSRTGSLADKKLPKGTMASLFEGMEAIETPDASTVVVRFKEPFSPFLNYTATDFTTILPKEIFDQDGHFQDRIIGSGPFLLDPAASRAGSLYVWKKNPTYFETGKPYLEEVRWLVLKEMAAEQAAFATKQIDYTGMSSGIDPQVGQEIIKMSPSAVVYEFEKPVGLTLYISSKTGPLSDVRIRKAVSLATDRDEFAKLFGAGKGSWTLSGTFAGQLFNQDEIRKMLRYDPAEATRLVQEAGHPNGVQLRLNFDKEELLAQAQLMQSQLKKGGINLILDPLTGEEASQSRNKGTFELNFVPQTTADGDVDSLLFGSFHSQSGRNYGGANDPKLDALLVAQRKEGDPAKRAELMREAVRIINVDGVWGQSIYTKPHYILWQPNLRGVYPSYWRKGLSAKDIWVVK